MCKAPVKSVLFLSLGFSDCVLCCIPGPLRVFCVCMCYVFGCFFRLSVPVQVTDWKDSPPERPTKVKVKVHTLDIAPLRSESPSHKHSGMACVLKRFHSFTCIPTRSSAIGMSHTWLCLPSYSWYSFTNPGGMEGRVDLGAK